MVNLDLLSDNRWSSTGMEMQCTQMECLQGCYFYMYMYELAVHPHLLGIDGSVHMSEYFFLLYCTSLHGGY